MNKKQSIINNLRLRRKIRIKSRILGTKIRPRVAVFRSLKSISAQIIDDAVGKTLAAASEKDIKLKKGKKVEKATAVGKALAEKAVAKGIKKVVFDRANKKYHGRVKALADGLREGGLEF